MIQLPTINNVLYRFKAKFCRLYEQGASKQRLAAYVKRWVKGVVLMNAPRIVHKNTSLFKKIGLGMLCASIKI